MDTEKLHEKLFNKEDGLLIKFHFNNGLDLDKLQELYTLLDLIKIKFQNDNSIPKDVVRLLILIVPALYNDLAIYKNSENYDIYEEKIEKLAYTLEMCF